VFFWLGPFRSNAAALKCDGRCGRRSARSKVDGNRDQDADDAEGDEEHFRATGRDLVDKDLAHDDFLLLEKKFL
jgi:hypothetical protein